MSDHFLQQIRKNFEKKSTLELRRVVSERDSGDWSEDAVNVAEELLAVRPDEPYEDDSSNEKESIDRRGQVLLELTPSEIAAYRVKIKLLGWLFCIAGVPATLLFFTPIFFGEVNLLFSVVYGLLGLMLGLFFVHTGAGLIRLNPRSKTKGLVISVILLPFFPIGTIIGICGVTWLGKRGSVLDSAPSQNSELPNKS